MFSCEDKVCKKVQNATSPKESLQEGWLQPFQGCKQSFLCIMSEEIINLPRISAFAFLPHVLVWSSTFSKAYSSNTTTERSRRSNNAVYVNKRASKRQHYRSTNEKKKNNNNNRDSATNAAISLMGKKENCNGKNHLKRQIVYQKHRDDEVFSGGKL